MIHYSNVFPRADHRSFVRAILDNVIRNGKAVIGDGGGKKKKGSGKRYIMFIFLVNLHFTCGAAQGKMSGLLKPIILYVYNNYKWFGRVSTITIMLFGKILLIKS